MIARKYRSQGQFFRLPLVVVTPIAHETGTELFSVAAFQGSVRSKPLLFSFQVAVLADGRKHKAISALTALYSSSPIVPPAASPALPVRGGAAGRLLGFRRLSAEIANRLAAARKAARFDPRAVGPGAHLTPEELGLGS